MRNELKKYRKQYVKTKRVEFYKKDEELFNFANSINFQGFCKELLRKEYLKHNGHNKNIKG